MPACKTFRVTFTDTRYRRIELAACCHDHALEIAAQLYRLDPDDLRFGDIGGEPFQDAAAHEVLP